MIRWLFILISFFSIAIVADAQRYKRIHTNAILVDTHNDFPSASIEKKVSFDADLLGTTHSDIARMRQGGVDV